MSNLITRGLSSKKQTLVVWGLLGAVQVKFVGAGPGSPEAYSDYLKQGTVWFKEEFNIEGAKEYKLKQELIIIGNIEKGIAESIYLEGIKELNFVFEQCLSGNKQYPLNETISLIGEKELTLEERFNLYGIKEISLNECIEVSGKKDIMNILTALDIL